MVHFDTQRSKRHGQILDAGFDAITYCTHLYPHRISFMHSVHLSWVMNSISVLLRSFHKLTRLQVVPFVRMIAIRRYDMMWHSLIEHVSHVGEDREALDENLRLRNEASMSYAPTWWASFDSVKSDVKIRIGSKSMKGKYISLAISCQP